MAKGPQPSLKASVAGLQLGPYSRNHDGEGRAGPCMGTGDKVSHRPRPQQRMAGVPQTQCRASSPKEGAEKGILGKGSQTGSVVLGARGGSLDQESSYGGP